MGTLKWDDLTPYQKYVRLLLQGEPDARSRAGTYPLSDLLEGDEATQLSQVLLTDAPPDPRELLLDNLRSVLVSAQLRYWEPILDTLASSDLPFGERQAEHIRMFSVLGTAVLEASPAHVTARIDEFLKFLIEALNWGARGKVPDENAVYHKVRIEQEYLHLPDEMLVIVTAVNDTDDPQVKHDDVADAQRRLSSTQGGAAKLAMNIVLGNEGAVSRYEQLASREDNILLLTAQDLARAFLSARYHREIREVVRRRLGIARLNPYRAEKPVDRVDMFFGRTHETTMILDNPSTDFMLLGPRKIGKTSLCQFIKSTIEEGEDGGALLVNVAALEDAVVDLPQKIMMQIEPRKAMRASWKNLEHNVSIARSLRSRRFMFLFDEVDVLVRASKTSGDWRPFEVLRALSQKQHAQTIFTGYSTLYREYSNLRSPLYNFARPLRLTCLSANGAKRLIVEPMRRLGVEYDGTRPVDHIVQQTGGHPAFVQFFCDSLVRLLDREPRPDLKITMHDVGLVCRQPEYKEYVLRVYQYEENLSPLARLVLLKLATSSLFSFKASDVLGVLRDEGELSPTSVFGALFELEVAGQIESVIDGDPFRPRDEETSYRFTIPAFPLVAMQSFPMQRLIADLRRAVRGG